MDIFALEKIILTAVWKMEVEGKEWALDGQFECQQGPDLKWSY